MKLTLKYPFPADGGVNITEVNIDRPVTARDLVIVGGNLDDDDTYFRATANALGIAPKFFDAVDFEDLEDINTKLDELGKALPAYPEGFTINRPKGRDVVDVQRDRTAENLVKVITRLTGRPESEVLDLTLAQFTALVGKVSDFLGRRVTK